MTEVDPNTAAILVSKEPLAEASPAVGAGIRITWRGQYVTPYFKEFERKQYIALADALYRSTNARYGALYARCAQGVARYLGAWFRGPNVGGAVWSLVAQMGLFADVPQIPNVKPSDGPEQWAAPLNRLSILAQSITRRQAAFTLASSAGNVSEYPGQYVTIEFPFMQGFRANSASQRFIRTLAVASSASK